MEQWTPAWSCDRHSDGTDCQGDREEPAFTDYSPCQKRTVYDEDGDCDTSSKHKKYKTTTDVESAEPTKPKTEPLSSLPPPPAGLQGNQHPANGISAVAPFREPPRRLPWAVLDETAPVEQMADAAVPNPISHRVIEKRRRDRMNSCLADLSHLVPSCNQRKGRGRIEKTEIIEQAIKYIRELQEKLARFPDANRVTEGARSRTAAVSNRYEEGYRECLRETMQWMVEHEGFMPSDPICARLMSHLHEHIGLVLRGGFPPRPHHCSASSSLSSSTSGYNGKTSSNNGSSSDGNGGSTLWSGSSTPSGSPPEPPQQQDMVQLALPSSAMSSVESSSGPAAPGATSRFPDAEPPLYDQARLYKLLHLGGTRLGDGAFQKQTSEAKRAHLPSSSSSRSSEEGAGFMYKFKTSMKKRFSADMGDELGPKRSRRPPLPPSGERRPPAVSLSRGAALSRRQVPVFALHSRGSLYLPMTVYLEALGSQAELLAAEPLSIVHPVNISVCFCERRPPPVPYNSGEPPSSSGVSSLPAEQASSEQPSMAG